MINKQKVFVKIKEFIIEIISEFLSNKKIIGMVILMIFVAVFKVSINGFINPKSNDSIDKIRYEKLDYNWLNSDENELVKKFFKGEINDDSSKLKFSTLMKGYKGSLTIMSLKAFVKDDRENDLINDLTMSYWIEILNKMEKTKTEWSSQKLKVKNESNDKKSNN